MVFFSFAVSVWNAFSWPASSNDLSRSASTQSTACSAPARSARPVVGRGHVSLLISLDTWHTKRVMDIVDL
jgi:hypothetical protein